MRSVRLLLIMTLCVTAFIRTARADETVSSVMPTLTLDFFSHAAAPPPSLHERIQQAWYDMFDRDRTIGPDSWLSPVYLRSGTGHSRSSWLLSRFTGKSDGLSVIPILSGGVHISYRFDF